VLRFPGTITFTISGILILDHRELPEGIAGSHTDMTPVVARGPTVASMERGDE